MSEPVRRPKTSIFEHTLPGVSVEAAPRSGFFARFRRQDSGPELQPEEGSEPTANALKRPRTSIFEHTLPGLRIETAPPVMPDSEDWDEGTSTEWHPRFAGQMGSLAPALAPRADHGARLRFGAWIGGFALVILAFGAWAMRPPQAPVPAPKSVPEALKAYHQQAEAGDVGAMRLLGLRYAYGIGVAPDLAEGKAWLRKAAKAGSSTAQRELEALGGRAESVSGR